MPPLAQLNYHHLRYFWAVAHDGNLTRTALRLRVSQSALSTQIRLLEGELGQVLFERQGRALALTEAGRIVLAYADEIFGAGEQLLSTLKDGRARGDTLRIGAVATLSRNFQGSFLKPLLEDPEARVRLLSSTQDDLLARLEAHELDLVLSNRSVPSGGGARARLLARQAVSLVGRPGPPIRFPDDIDGHEMLLPPRDSELRAAFDALCEQVGVRVTAVAEVDDMALLRLLARGGRALALLPSIVVRDELQRGVLHEHCEVPGLYENFYAIVVDRRFQHPLLEPLLRRDPRELLQTGL